MITIPTSELVTVLEGALGFVTSVKTDPMRGLLVEWDGESLHASAYDVLSGVRVSWTAGAGREGTDSGNDDDEPLPNYGGADAPWRTFVSFDDAKDLVKVFKLSAKFWWIPVALKITPTGSRLFAERSREFGKPETLLTLNSDTDMARDFPDVCYIAEQTIDAPAGPGARIEFAPHRIGAYSAIQIGETMRMTFGAEGEPTAITMGSRVIGFAYPTGTQKADARVHHQPNFLRDAAGVHLERTGDDKTRGSVAVGDQQ